jgi:beta-lactam-binding protein with PASTA domain/predicted Ser/Thr protein kinase
VSAPPLEPDTVIDGRYRLVCRVGSGGMADVWLAEDAQLGRRVAIKLLHRRFAADEQFAERFRREASHAAGLQHPNIVAVYDRGEWDGTWYIAMEYVEGPTLKEIVRERGALPPELAIDVVVQILRAARYAHKHGIVHRDLKPHNVILDEEGRVKVTDFGIARAGASEMTETGAIMGTAQYLSPEQAQGLPVDARSDLYSIGVILYELLTGRVPFDAESAVTIALKHVSEPPIPPSELVPGIPPALEAVVLKAMAKDPADRYQDADAFIADLQAARDAPLAATVFAPASVPPAVEVLEEEDRRNQRWWLWLIVLLALAAAAFGAYLLLRPETRTVPDVIGQRSATASQILQNRGFEVNIETVVNPEVPRDRVATQRPGPGQQAEVGSTVTIIVSAGPGEAVVPQVNGLPRAQAEAALRAAGFKVAVTEAFSADVPKGRVISSSPPESTTAERGATVRLTVSKGAQPVAVPDVVGEQVDDARRILEADGFKVATEDDTESTADPGTVTAQAPKAGGKLARGGKVTLQVAKGAEVPDVVDLDQAEAETQLRAAGLEVRVVDVTVDNEAQDGVVLRQNPAAGTTRPRGATVTIRVGRFAGVATPTPTPAPTETPFPTPTETPIP